MYRYRYPQKIFRYKIFGFLMYLQKIFTDEFFSISVAYPYHFDTDPDPESEKIHYGSGSATLFSVFTSPKTETLFHFQGA